MPIEFDASLEFDSASLILERHGLALGGPAQTFVDSEVIRYCDPKVPFETGMVKDSAPDGCTITLSITSMKRPNAALTGSNGPWQSIRRISSAEFRLS